MKVNRTAQAKSQAKSQKWKDVRGKRCRPTVTSSELNSTPVLAKMSREHQAATKKKPNVKRLQNKAKPVSNTKKINSESGLKKSYSQINGGSAFNMDSDSDNSQEWKEYSQSVERNGVETSADCEEDRPGRLEGKNLQYCAARTSQQNHAVLVMQNNQVNCGVIFN